MSDSIDSGRLMTFVERLERLAEEKKEISEMEKEVVAEIKSSGLEPKYIKKIISERKRDPEEREADESMWIVYKEAASL